MYRSLSAALLLVVLVATFTVTAPAQTGNGQVNGTVQDISKALVPGVTVTLTNTATGVVSTQVTNESGIYNFPVVTAGYLFRSALRCRIQDFGNQRCTGQSGSGCASISRWKSDNWTRK
jgi:hypothetical protein